MPGRWATANSAPDPRTLLRSTLRTWCPVVRSALYWKMRIDLSAPLVASMGAARSRSTD
jgi:hypothetical protein